MIIALDYDHTFTKDPQGWLSFAEIMSGRGHQIIGVTMRYEDEKRGMDARYSIACSAVYFTGRKGKRPWLSEKAITVDVWIDDTPEFIIMSASA